MIIISVNYCRKYSASKATLQEEVGKASIAVIVKTNQPTVSLVTTVRTVPV